MHWNIVTLFPAEMKQVLSMGLLGQGFEKSILKLETYNPRDFATNKNRSVDDRPFGGGDGMIMQAEVLHETLTHIHEKHGQTEFYYLSPQGPVLNEALVQEISKKKNVTLLCGRYGGIDQRLLNHWHMQEISIGDYVLAGGELAAAVLIEACARKVPGVLGHDESAEQDSHAQGWLECPLLTRPRLWLEEEVPEILLSGDHQKIKIWKDWVSILVTLKKRPDIYQAQRAKIENQVPGTKANQRPTKEPLKTFSVAELIQFWQSLSPKEIRVLGLETLTLQDFK